MNLHQCILTENDCYKTNQWITPKGVMVHSTGANNTCIGRYVQPLPGWADYETLIQKIGLNHYGNHWNQSNAAFRAKFDKDLDACVHAFIGRLADGSVGTVQTLPWNMRGWHAGNGTTRPSANNTHISFEICEDGLDDADYFAKVYREAVEFTAYLCGLYGLDPMKEETVICHSEGYRLGMASGHADVEHWFPRFGKSMDDFRADVAAEMEDEDMTQEKFDEMMDNWLTRKALQEPSSWSQADREWAQNNGLMKGIGDADGDGETDYAYKAFPTREEMIAVQHRFYNLIKSE